MKRLKLLNSVYYLVISIVIINSLYYYNLNNFYFKEFFLNYCDGFVRRGIDGELLYNIGMYLQISPLIVIPIATIFVITLFFILLIKFLIDKEYLWIVIFSMPVLLSEIYYGSIFRKDLYVLLLILMQFNIIFKMKNWILKYLILFGVSIFSMFFHEIFFFLTLVPLALLFVFKKYRLISLMLIVINTVLFLITYKYSGYKIDSKVIIESWNLIDSNIKSYLDRLDRILYVRSTIVFKSSKWNFNSALNYLFVILLNFYFIVGIIINKIENTRKNIFIATFVLNNFILLMLCIIAADFSRWFFMVNLISIVFPFLIDNQSLENFNKKIIVNNTFVKIMKFFNYKLSYFLFLFIGMPFFGLWNFKEYIEKTPIGILWSIIKDYS
ncbi:hypothetical protein [Chryseobacterium sp. T1]